MTTSMLLTVTPVRESVIVVLLLVSTTDPLWSHVINGVGNPSALQSNIRVSVLVIFVSCGSSVNTGITGGTEQ